MIGGKIIRATNELVLLENSNSLLVKQKLTLRYFLLAGLIAFAFKKSEKKRTIPNIDQIIKITYKSSFMSGNMIILQFNKLTYILEMSNKDALVNCLNYLKSTKLSTLIIEK